MSWEDHVNLTTCMDPSSFSNLTLGIMRNHCKYYLNAAFHAMCIKRCLKGRCFSSIISYAPLDVFVFDGFSFSTCTLSSVNSNSLRTSDDFSCPPVYLKLMSSPACSKSNYFLSIRRTGESLFLGGVAVPWVPAQDVKNINMLPLWLLGSWN